MDIISAMTWGNLGKALWQHIHPEQGDINPGMVLQPETACFAFRMLGDLQHSNRMKADETGSPCIRCQP